MTFALRPALLFALACVLSLANGCVYHDFDLETVDHYSHYGARHSVDATFYHGDGDDYF